MCLGELFFITGSLRDEVFTLVTVKIVFLDVPGRSLPTFERTCCLHLWQVPQKSWQLCTKLHGVTFQKTLTFLGVSIAEGLEMLIGTYNRIIAFSLELPGLYLA
jgi:hypothetical protein